jgi:hypothetical protein
VIQLLLSTKLFNLTKEIGSSSQYAYAYVTTVLPVDSATVKVVCTGMSNPIRNRS